jgi:hypothetical protein
MHVCMRVRVWEKRLLRRRHLPPVSKTPYPHRFVIINASSIFPGTLKCGPRFPSADGRQNRHGRWGRVVLRRYVVYPRARTIV